MKGKRMQPFLMKRYTWKMNQRTADHPKVESDFNIFPFMMFCLSLETV
jgi:hypothetical protein